MPKKIIMARITGFPVDVLVDPMPEVHVTFEGGQDKFLFSYYPDEISFLPSDFIGLTEEQAHELKGIRDREYLKRC